MILKDIVILIGKLQEENKTNSKEEREFNLKWIEEIKKSIKASI